MDSTPLDKVLNEDNVTRSKKKDSSKKMDSSVHQARKEENPSRRNKTLREHQTL